MPLALFEICTAWVYITTDLSEKHTFGSTDTEISITDIENQCAVSKWKIDTVISTSNTGKTILQQQYLIGFFFFFRSCCKFRKCQIPPIDIFASFTCAFHISDRWWWLKNKQTKNMKCWWSGTNYQWCNLESANVFSASYILSQVTQTRIILPQLTSQMLDSPLPHSCRGSPPFP